MFVQVKSSVNVRVSMFIKTVLSVNPTVCVFRNIINLISNSYYLLNTMAIKLGKNYSLYFIVLLISARTNSAI